MLKALELTGFKSFADATKFEFPGGITVVVGPNGSGKSNVVDAFRWIFGEQSVKSLRGVEMVDVIFNGSSSRSPMNFAEATLVLDNTAKSLPIDASEVHITRRVYRGGEGEYLINKQPCRRRDIRELFFGTGLGNDAYCVIEQGKVDLLLQSSPRDRRVIFEEAAGISRFKAKKIETQRRLERVEQNLLRLSDIVQEVEGRLKSIRHQASKAQRYRDVSHRLRGLRSQQASIEWRRHSGTLETQLVQLRREEAQLSECERQAAELETQSHEHEIELGETERRMRNGEARLAKIQERITAAETLMEREIVRHDELDEDVIRGRQQRVELSRRSQLIQAAFLETKCEITHVEEEVLRYRGLLNAKQADIAALSSRIGSLREEFSQLQQQLDEHYAQATDVSRQRSSAEAKLQAGRDALRRDEARLAEVESLHATAAAELEQIDQFLLTAERSAESYDEQLKLARSELGLRQEAVAEHRELLAKFRQDYAVAVERASVLEELERQGEGLNDGIKEIMATVQHRDGRSGSLILGLVADVLRVKVEMAPLIELALADRANYIVVSDIHRFMSEFADCWSRLQGRVGIVWAHARSGDTVPVGDLAGDGGIVGRAIDFVDTDAGLASLARKLLGHVWIVEGLADAFRLIEGRGSGCLFVTTSGEVVHPDGTFSAGPKQAAAGLISRKSELRELSNRISDLVAAIEAEESQRKSAAELVAEQQEKVHRIDQEYSAALEKAHNTRLERQSVSDRLQNLAELRAELERDTSAGRHETQRTSRALADLAEQDERIRSDALKLESGAQQYRQDAAALEAQREAATRELTFLQVTHGKLEQQLEHLLSRQKHHERDDAERCELLADADQHLAACLEKRREAVRNILRVEIELAQLYLRKESFARDLADCAIECRATRDQRQQLADNAREVQARIRRLQEQVNDKKLEVNNTTNARESVALRLRTDYGIEIQDIAPSVDGAGDPDGAELDKEISRLQNQLNSLGGVNMEAVSELETLESRFATLSGQYDDLAKAKSSLAQIIHRINADSRRMFLETVDSIRGHFEEFFRKLFGGGKADILLEEGEDELEAGIQIIARPPGKEPKNISLLSGGEKTLTCVALLLAIFRSRPSPFCILDEVDAALDEANIERFIRVLQEFLPATQFVVVTHSKKTMTAADTLYGVTMQESGVSRRVSVRFEDVHEDGHFTSPAPAENATPKSDSSGVEAA